MQPLHYLLVAAIFVYRQIGFAPKSIRELKLLTADAKSTVVEITLQKGTPVSTLIPLATFTSTLPWVNPVLRQNAILIFIRTTAMQKANVRWLQQVQCVNILR